MTKLKLIGDRILLKQLPKPSVSPGGIVLIESFNDDRMQWEVLQVGPKVKLEVAVGDHILVTQYHGNECDLGDGRIIIRGEQIKHDVIAVWKPAPPATAPENATIKPDPTYAEN